MTQDNLGKYYNNEQSKLNIGAFKATFKSMVIAQYWQNKYNTIEAQKGYNQVEWNDNLINRGFGVVGDALRGLGGGLLSGSYNLVGKSK